MYMCACTNVCMALWRPEGDSRSLVAGVIGNCEPPRYKFWSSRSTLAALNRWALSPGPRIAFIYLINWSPSLSVKNAHLQVIHQGLWPYSLVGLASWGLKFNSLAWRKTKESYMKRHGSTLTHKARTFWLCNPFSSSACSGATPPSRCKETQRLCDAQQKLPSISLSLQPTLNKKNAINLRYSTVASILLLNHQPWSHCPAFPPLSLPGELQSFLLLAREGLCLKKNKNKKLELTVGTLHCHCCLDGKT